MRTSLGKAEELRFRENGPAIPDELLVARDAGQVLFFCGAGVSTAKARLPGFLGLADKVLNQLKALPDSPARQLMKVVGELQGHKITGVGGIVAADRIFGLLEREFALKDIEGAVGGALKPRLDASLTVRQAATGDDEFRPPVRSRRSKLTPVDAKPTPGLPSPRRFRRHRPSPWHVGPRLSGGRGRAASVVECGIRKSVSGGKLGD